MKYRFGGKEKRLSFGMYPLVSLADARKKRDKAKKLLVDGIDPAEIKKIEKMAQKMGMENSFESIAREWHKSKVDR